MFLIIDRLDTQTSPLSDATPAMQRREFLFFSKHFTRDVGPNGVRPRASAAGPYTLGCGHAALCNPVPRFGCWE